MSEDLDFRRAARRVLFENPEKTQDIPGAGKSAADDSERHIRVKVTINLDGDIITYFKEWAKEEGRAYQSLINQVLREYIDGSRPEQLAKDVGEVLLNDPTYLEKLADKIKEKKGGG